MTGSLQVKSDKFYAVLNFKNQEGKRVQKWICLNLPVRGNKRKAEAMLRELQAQYQGLESIEPINTLLSQHIANWIEYDRPHITVTTYNQYVMLLCLSISRQPIIQWHFRKERSGPTGKVVMPAPLLSVF